MLEFKVQLMHAGGYRQMEGKRIGGIALPFNTLPGTLDDQARQGRCLQRGRVAGRLPLRIQQDHGPSLLNGYRLLDPQGFMHAVSRIYSKLDRSMKGDSLRRLDGRNGRKRLRPGTGMGYAYAGKGKQDGGSDFFHG